MARPTLGRVARPLTLLLNLPKGILENLARPNGRASDHDHEFQDTFWPAYPCKKAKPKALAAFKSQRKAHSLETIMAGLQRYIREKPPDRSWLYPVTFLNQERFNDEPEPRPAFSNGPGRRHRPPEPTTTRDAAAANLSLKDYKG